MYRENHTFFGHIGSLSEEEFVKRYLSRNDDKHLEMILRAVHIRSIKAKTKFTLLAFATAATIVQFLPAAARLC